MTIESFLSKLDKVRRRGNSQWMASCPCHQDKTPSLSIKDDNGTIIMHCFSQGCSAHDICAAIGFDMVDLFPPSDNYDASQPRTKRPFHDAQQVLEGLAYESLVLLITAKHVLQSKMISDEDYERLSAAVMRIHSATEYTKRIIR